MQTSGMGAVPKSNGKLRVIQDLSSPDDSSYNDAIPRGQFSLHYDSVDTAIAAIMRLGKGSLLTKVDICNAFRLCPVTPSDWHLLGIRWNGMYYYEKVLPFGLRPSPFIFNQLATAINWVLVYVGSLPDAMHYLDDFFDICPPSSSLAAKHKAIILDLFQFLNVPVATEKVEGPSTVLTFFRFGAGHRSLGGASASDLASGRTSFSLYHLRQDLRSQMRTRLTPGPPLVRFPSNCCRPYTLMRPV